MPVLDREFKMKNTHLSGIWKESTRNAFTLEMKIQHPLKDQLCRISCDPSNPQHLRVRPKPFFRQLAANDFF